MILKRSLLKESKRDKRPIYGPLTLWEDMLHSLDNYYGEQIRKDAEKYDEWLLDMVKRTDKGTNKVIRIVRCSKIQLPGEEDDNSK